MHQGDVRGYGLRCDAMRCKARQGKATLKYERYPHSVGNGHQSGERSGSHVCPVEVDVQAEKESGQGFDLWNGGARPCGGCIFTNAFLFGGTAIRLMTRWQGVVFFHISKLLHSPLGHSEKAGGKSEEKSRLRGGACRAIYRPEVIPSPRRVRPGERGSKYCYTKIICEFCNASLGRLNAKKTTGLVKHASDGWILNKGAKERAHYRVGTGTLTLSLLGKNKTRLASSPGEHICRASPRQSTPIKKV